MKTATRQELSSAQNPLLRTLRRALREGEPGPEGAFGVEGPHLVEEALRSPVEVTALVAARSAEARLAALEARANGSTVAHHAERKSRHGRLRSYLVPDRLFRSLAQTETPQGIAALVRLPEARLDDCLSQRNALVVALIGLQDPGNLGTILRSLEAFGGTACLLSENTVSPFNPKAARASAGSLFRVPVFRRLKLDEILRACQRQGLRTVALAPRGDRALGQVDLRGAAALFIGQEGSGLPMVLLPKVDTVAAIPLSARVESLNAAMAATLALYEAARQRAS